MTFAIQIYAAGIKETIHFANKTDRKNFRDAFLVACKNVLIEQGLQPYHEFTSDDKREIKLATMWKYQGEFVHFYMKPVQTDNDLSVVAPHEFKDVITTLVEDYKEYGIL